jgi:uncharacterized protein (DUF2236 family)
MTVVRSPLSALPLRGPCAWVEPVRQRIGASVRASLGASERIDVSDPLRDPGWYGPNSMAWRVHGDVAAMLIGGVSSLLLQTLHPGAMAGVDQHSNWRIDPTGRLQRTAQFLAATTFGTSAEAEAAAATVRAIHERVRGVRDDGVAYAASDPELLRWVHVTEVFQFLRAYQRYGAEPLSRTQRDDYLREVARTGESLGATRLPRSVREVERYFGSVRHELAATPTAVATAHELVRPRQRDAASRVTYELIARAAIGLLPGWARASLGLQRRSLVEDQAAQVAGCAFAVTLRWALRP